MPQRHGSCAAVLPLVDVGDSGGRPAVFALRLAGVPLLTHALTRLAEAGLRTIVAAPDTVDLSGVVAGVVAGESPPVAPRGDARGAAGVPSGPTTLVEHDGSYRSALRAALDVLPAEVTSVLVHDLANPATPVEVLEEAVRRAGEPDRPVVITRRVVADTIKVISGGFVGDTVPRDELESVHAPLVAPRELLAGVLVATRPQGLVELVAEVASAATRVIRIDGTAASLTVRDQADLDLLECALPANATSRSAS